MSEKIMPIPPGRTIAEQLEIKGLSRYEFGIRTCWLDDFIDRLIEGKEDITVHVAYKLEAVLGPPAQFWLNLEERYRKKLIAFIEQLQKEVNENARK